MGSLQNLNRTASNPPALLMSMWSCVFTYFSTVAKFYQEVRGITQLLTIIRCVLAASVGGLLGVEGVMGGEEPSTTGV